MLLHNVLTYKPLLNAYKHSCLKFRPSHFNLKTSTGFSTSARLAGRTKRSRRDKEVLDVIRLGPGEITSNVGSIAISTGQALVIGSSVLGLVSLCFYGLGMSKETSALDRAVMWPKYVRKRVRDTYKYFGASLGVIALSAYKVATNQNLMRLISKQGKFYRPACAAVIACSSNMCESIRYKPGFGLKQMTWLLNTTLIGGIIVAPMTIFGGSIILRAALFTAGISAGVSSVALCAPSETFLDWAAPLAACLGVVLVSALGSVFVPTSGVVGLTMYSTSTYGGLVLYGMYLLHDVHAIIKKAETHPFNHDSKHDRFDPINASMAVYMDVLNTFIRIVIMLVEDEEKKRRE